MKQPLDGSYSNQRSSAETQQIPRDPRPPALRRAQRDASPSRGQKTECTFRKSYPRRKTLIHLFMSFQKQMRPEGTKITFSKINEFPKGTPLCESKSCGCSLNLRCSSPMVQRVGLSPRCLGRETPYLEKWMKTAQDCLKKQELF